MPAANKTDNIELNQWLGNEYPKREDFNADNLKIDTAITGTNNDLAAHLADEMPHQFTSTNKTYRYGFKAQDNHLIFTYEEVV